MYVFSFLSVYVYFEDTLLTLFLVPEYSSEEGTAINRQIKVHLICGLVPTKVLDITLIEPNTENIVFCRKEIHQELVSIKKIKTYEEIIEIIITINCKANECGGKKPAYYRLYIIFEQPDGSDALTSQTIRFCCNRSFARKTKPRYPDVLPIVQQQPQFIGQQPSQFIVSQQMLQLLSEILQLQQSQFIVSQQILQLLQPQQSDNTDPQHSFGPQYEGWFLDEDTHCGNNE